jgi:hypothetical protein
MHSFYCTVFNETHDFSTSVYINHIGYAESFEIEEEMQIKGRSVISSPRLVYIVLLAFQISGKLTHTQHSCMGISHTEFHRTGPINVKNAPKLLYILGFCCTSYNKTSRNLFVFHENFMCLISFKSGKKYKQEV